MFDSWTQTLLNLIGFPVLQKVQEERKSKEDLELQAFLAEKGRVLFEQLSGNKGIEKYDAKWVIEQITNRKKIEGVFFRNNFAFVDDDFPNKFNCFTGNYENTDYVDGKRNKIRCN